MARWVVYFLVKCGLTFGCAITLHTLTQREGYRLELSTLIIASLLLVLMIKTWSFNYQRDDV